MSVATERTFVVPQRFCGPPTSGNGGYTCGMTAQAISVQRQPGAPAVECTIRKPIPLERELRIEIRGGEAFALDDDETIVEARLTTIDLALPHPISLEQTHAAATRSPAFQNHPFPTCFVCGPERGEHDGLRIFPGPTLEAPDFPNLYAAAWHPAREFADANGLVKPEFLWASMDCPTGFAAGFPYQGKLVTGRLAVKILEPVRAEQDCVLMSWSVGNDGRKCHAAAVLYQKEQACAIAGATWIRIQ